MRCELVLLALALAACDRPQPLVICHNGNCVEPTDPERDDTLEALEESLALEVNGRPAIDGIEIDTFWRGEDGTCLYAHDLDGARSTLASEPATVLAAHLAKRGPLTFSGAPLVISLELKGHVAAEKTAKHTPEQRALHAACAWDVYRVIADAAVANDQDAELIFSSFEPDVLRAVVDATPASTPMPYSYGAIYGIPKPLDPSTHPLDEYTGIPLSVVEVHDQWLNDAQYEGLLSANVRVVFWMFSATVETFAAIEQYEPDMVTTSEARLMRRWLED
ncbi:MAG TPA: hypothetical protein VM513_22720 [Kofleriaceae bacterium]|nr:hypothetical protein [Kofleriaceae bacterium]